MTYQEPQGLPVYVAMIRRRWRLVAITAAAITALAVTWGTITTPEYTATARILVSFEVPKGANKAAVAATYATDSQQQRIASYVELAQSDVVVRDALTDEGLAEDDSDISVTSPPGTNLIAVIGSGDEATVAQQSANAVARALVDLIGLSETANPSSGVAAATLAQPAANAESESLPPIRLAVFGLIAGLAFGMSAAIVREVLDSSIRFPARGRDRLATPVTGAIRRHESLKDRPSLLRPLASVPTTPDQLQAAISDHQAEAEDFRRLRTSVRHLQAESGLTSLAVTSANREEGRTCVALNLAVVMALGQSSVALVEADFRRPRLGDLLSMNSTAGLAQVLAGEAEISECMIGSSPFEVLIAGSADSAPSDRVDSSMMSDIIQELSRSHDIVILDTPAISEYSDALALSRRCDGTLLIAQSGKAKHHDVYLTSRALSEAGANLRGIVVNDVVSVELPRL